MIKNHGISLGGGAFQIPGQATAATVLCGFTRGLHPLDLCVLPCRGELQSESPAGIPWATSLGLTGHFGKISI